MKRRTVLLGAAGAAVTASTAGMLLWRPKDVGQPHDAYFSALNQLLREQGPGRPALLLDLDHINTNIDLISDSVDRKSVV